MVTRTQLFALVGASLASMTPAQGATVPAGTWAGDGAVLTVEAPRSRIRLDRGDVIIDGPIETDASGRFKHDARVEFYAPGPQGGDRAPVFHKAVIEGRLTAQTIELTMQVQGERAKRLYSLGRARVAKLVRPL